MKIAPPLVQERDLLHDDTAGSVSVPTPVDPSSRRATDESPPDIEDVRAD